MKITDIILVIENHKGIEKNYLCTFKGFINNHIANTCDNCLEVAEMVKELDATRGKFNACCKMYFASYKTIYAKYCTSIVELQIFLLGKLNDGAKHTFEEGLCDKECLEVMERMGIDKNGIQAMNKYPHYEKLEKIFEIGEVLHNFNGSDYIVLEKLSDKNLLLMGVGTGNFVVGVGVDYLAKYPTGEDMNSELCERAIEWQHGVYIYNALSLIDFESIHKKYGK